MPLSKIKTNSIADGSILGNDIADASITSAKIGSVSNTAVQGTMTSSQIGEGSLSRLSFPIDLDIRGRTIKLEGLLATVYTNHRWVLWWPKFNDGYYFHGTFSVTNYTQPAMYTCGIHNSYGGSTSLAGFAVTRNYGSQSISWKRVTYNGVQYLATYNGGETNREYFWSGWQNSGANFIPFAVPSVTTDHETYGGP